MPIKENREYRSMELRANVEPESYMVEGYATTFDSPYELFRDGQYIFTEQVSRDAFMGTDMSDVIFQLNHEGKVYARQSNGSLELNQDEHGLLTRANLSLTQSAREIFEEIKTGLLTKMSFAFTVTDDAVEYNEQPDGTTKVLRTIKRIGKLYDVSVVSIPANDQTSISARTLGEGVIAEIDAERRHAQEIKAKREALQNRLSSILEVKADE